MGITKRDIVIGATAFAGGAVWLAVKELQACESGQMYMQLNGREGFKDYGKPIFDPDRKNTNEEETSS